MLCVIENSNLRSGLLQVLYFLLTLIWLLITNNEHPFKLTLIHVVSLLKVYEIKIENLLKQIYEYIRVCI